MADYIILRKFENYGNCPKCKATSGDLDMTWCQGGAREGNCVGCSEEHLHITCGKCGFPWLSDTADAEERRRCPSHGASPASKPSTPEELTIMDPEGYA